MSAGFSEDTTDPWEIESIETLITIATSRCRVCALVMMALCGQTDQSSEAESVLGAASVMFQRQCWTCCVAFYVLLLRDARLPWAQWAVRGALSTARDRLW